MRDEHQPVEQWQEPECKLRSEGGHTLCKVRIEAEAASVVEAAKAPEQQQRASKRAKLELIELIVEDRRCKCQHADALIGFLEYSL